MGCRPSSLSSTTTIRAEPPTATTTSPPPPRRRASVRPNLPLRLLSQPPASPIPHPTSERLALERAAFFDTRVSGSRDLWAAVRAICSALRAGRLSEAQSFADAGGLTCPTGRVWEAARGAQGGGLFDERGERYVVPDWVVRDPNGMEGEGGGEQKRGDGGEEEEEQEETGKGWGKMKQETEDPGEQIWVRARLSSGTDLQVRMGVNERARVLVERIGLQLQRGGVVADIRLMYLGQRIDGEKTLLDQGWQREHVVNAMIVGGD